MSCESYVDLISARIDGELTLLEEAQLSSHLRECPTCRAIAEDLNGLHSQLAQMELTKAPSDLSQKVMDRIHTEKAARHIVVRQRRRVVRQLAGLAACLVLCVGAFRLLPSEVTNKGILLASETFSSGAGGAVGAKSRAVSSGGVSDMPNAAAETDLSVSPLTGDPSHYFFCNDQYIRVYGKTPAAPSACILGSTQSLAGFISQFETDLAALTGQYDAEYFKTGRLLAVVLEETSGSNRHQLAPQGLLYDCVTIIRQVPEAGTCDMASWLILAEVDTMFEDGQELSISMITAASAQS